MGLGGGGVILHEIRLKTDVIEEIKQNKKEYRGEVQRKK
jgi:hypothetical protein